MNLPFRENESYFYAGRIRMRECVFFPRKIARATREIFFLFFMRTQFFVIRERVKYEGIFVFRKIDELILFFLLFNIDVYWKWSSFVVLGRGLFVSDLAYMSVIYA